MIQLCKKIVEFHMVQHIDQIVSVAVAMRDSFHKFSKLKRSSQLWCKTEHQDLVIGRRWGVW